MKIKFLMIIIIFVSACTNKINENTHSQKIADVKLCQLSDYKKVILSYDTLQIFNDSIGMFLEKNCKLWLHSWSKPLSIYDFTRVNINYPITFGENKWDSLDKTSDFFDRYQKLLIYSADKKHCIDLYSYKLSITIKNNIMYALGEVDTKIFLFDILNNKFKLLAFSGSMEQYDDCFWISNHRLLFLASRSEFIREKEFYRPIIIIYDFGDKTYYEYAYRYTFEKLNDTYIKQKFPDIIFDY